MQQPSSPTWNFRTAPPAPTKFWRAVTSPLVGIVVMLCGLLASGAAIVLLFGHRPAYAAGNQSCSVIAIPDITFTDYNTVTKAAVQITAPMTLTCQSDTTGNQNIPVTFAKGLSNACPPSMFNGATKLKYDINEKSDYSSTLCGQSKTNYSMNFAAKNTDTTKVFTLYPEVNSGQNISVYGDYQDTFTAKTETNGTDANVTFFVNGHVPGTCTLSTGNLAFGTYTGAQSDATATVTVNCTNTAPYSVALGAGSNANGTTRRMTGPASQYLNYALYSDNGRSTTWGDGTSYGATVTGTGSGANQSLTVYGRVTASQTPTPGSYSDTVVVTLQY